MWQAVSDRTLSAGSLAAYPAIHFTEPARWWDETASFPQNCSPFRAGGSVCLLHRHLRAEKCQVSAQKGVSRSKKRKREVDLSFRQSLPGWFVERDLVAGIARLHATGTLETSRNFVYPEETATGNSILPGNNNTLLLK